MAKPRTYKRRKVAGKRGAWLDYTGNDYRNITTAPLLNVDNFLSTSWLVYNHKRGGYSFLQQNTAGELKLVEGQTKEQILQLLADTLFTGDGVELPPSNKK